MPLETGNDWPMVSVIVPTYGREAVLCSTLRMLLLQAYPRFEIIVVDQTADHDAETKEFLASVRDQIRYVHLNQANLPGARNAGVRIARGEILLFVDDDIEVGPGFIGAHARNYAAPDVGGVGGCVLDVGACYDNSPRPGFRITYWGRIYRNMNFPQKCEVEGIMGGNGSYRREVFMKVGLFDTGYVGTALLEETDFCRRVRRAGYRLLFEPEARMVHLRFPAGGCRAADPTTDEYYRVRNSSRYFFKHIPRLFLPLCLLTVFCLSARRLIKRTHRLRGLAILIRAVADAYKSLRDGPDRVGAEDADLNDCKCKPKAAQVTSKR